MNGWCDWVNVQRKCIWRSHPTLQILAFAPETFTANYQRSLYSSLRKLVRIALICWRARLPKLTPEVQEFAKKVLALEDKILECFSEVYQIKIKGIRQESTVTITLARFYLPVRIL